MRPPDFNMSDQLPTASRSAPTGKIAIPRLNSSKAPPRTRRDPLTNRVLRACTNCRVRRTRCDGRQPRCEKCVISDQPCVYMESRRHRLQTATEQNQAMMRLLRSLKNTVTEDDGQRIDDLLGRVTNDVSDAAAALKLPQQHTSDDNLESPGTPETSETFDAQVDPSSRASSLDGVDFTELNIGKDTQATGYIGRSSAIDWLRRLDENVQAQDEDPSGDNPGHYSYREPSGKEDAKRPAESDTDSSFYMDDVDLVVDYNLEAFQLPPMLLAQQMVERYIRMLQATYPIISSRQLRQVLQQCYCASPQRADSLRSRKQFSLLNLVMAIESRCLYLVQEVSEADDEQHVIFYSRAIILGLDDLASSSNPDLATVQISALLAFYLKCVGRVNRAWMVMGNSLRSAYALGLHLRNEDSGASVEKKEDLCRLWWAIYTLEESLSTTVGRPSYVSNGNCSTAFPLPLGMEDMPNPETINYFPLPYRKAGIQNLALRLRWSASDLPNSGSYLMALVHLSVITHEVMEKLYSTQVVDKSWQQVQEIITDLCRLLESWSESLPRKLVFDSPVNDEFARERCILRMYHARTKILITRPCLCRLDRRIAVQTKRSNQWDLDIARMCIESAKSLVNAMPDTVDVVHLYQNGPWWSMVHGIMQAAIVLLLELTFGASHLSGHEQDTLRHLKKLLLWLMAMKERNKIAERGYRSIWTIVQKLAPRYQADLSRLLEQDAQVPIIPTESPMDPQFIFMQDHSTAAPQSTQHGAHTAYAPMFGFPVQHTPQFLSPPRFRSSNNSSDATSSQGANRRDEFHADFG